MSDIDTTPMTESPVSATDEAAAATEELLAGIAAVDAALMELERAVVHGKHALEDLHRANERAGLPPNTNASRLFRTCMRDAAWHLAPTFCKGAQVHKVTSNWRTPLARMAEAQVPKVPDGSSEPSSK